MDKKSLNRDQLIELALVDVTKDRETTPKIFYQSTAWKKTKNSYLTQKTFCELCANEGKETKSRAVHHIIPMAKGGDELSEDNLMSLCVNCHRSIHGRVGATISPKQWLMEPLENTFDERGDRWGPNIKGIDIVAYEDEDLNFFCAECGDPETMEPSIADDFISFDGEELELFTCDKCGKWIFDQD